MKVRKSPLFSRRGAVALLFSSLTCVAVAHASLSGIGTSEVQFRAIGPGGLQIDGKGGNLVSSEKGGVLTIKAPLAELKTGISLRDSHLHDALHADKHPYATLSIKRSALKFPEDKKTQQASAKADFTLNGVTQSQDISYKVERTGSDYHVQGLATVDITRYKLEKPCYLGVCVDKDVKIKVKFKLRDN